MDFSVNDIFKFSAGMIREFNIVLIYDFSNIGSDTFLTYIKYLFGI